MFRKPFKNFAQMSLGRIGLALIAAGNLAVTPARANDLDAAIDTGVVASLEFQDPASLDSTLNDSFSNDDFQNLKVVGRGIRDRKTGQVLKLACVGKRLRNSDSERSCDVLNFLYTDYSGVTRLIGAPFTLKDGAKAQQQLKNQMRRRGLEDGALASSTVMAETRHLFKKNDRGARLTVGLIGGLSLLSGIAIVPSLAIGLSFLTIPDLVILPFALVEDAKFRDPALKSQNISALQDRSKPYWQIAPQTIRSKRFQRVYSVLSGETVQNSFLDSLGEQILEDEEELEAEAREDTIARYTSPVAGFGKIEDPCFVDRLEVDVRGDYLKKILGSEGKKHELASIFPDQVVKLAVIQKLTRHGYRFDVMTILKGTGYRGSVLQFSAKEKILLNRMSKAEFELIHSREQLPLAETSTRFTNTSSLDRKSVNQMINDVTNEYFGHMQMTCEESLRAKKSHMNVSTF